MVKDDPKIGDSTSFDLSIQLGFSGEEHASLAGLPLSRRSTKDLIAAYNERVEELASEPKPDGFQGPEVVEEPVEEEKKDDIGPASGQMKLF